MVAWGDDAGEGPGVTALHVRERPEKVWLLEWSDLFGEQRQAITMTPADVNAIAGARITEGKVVWQAKCACCGKPLVDTERLCGACEAEAVL